MAAPAFGATDVLTLGADWEPIDSSGSLARQRATAGGDDGDIVAEAGYNAQQTGQARYHYIGGEVAFVAAFAAADCWPGRLLATNTLFVNSLSVDYSPCAQGELPIIQWDVQDGPTAAPTTPFEYVTALVLPTYRAALAPANLIVPAIFTATAGDAEIQTCRWTIRCQHGRSLNKDGEYLAGQAFQGEEQIDQTWVGYPTSITSTGFIATSEYGIPVSGMNTGYPTYNYSFVRRVTRSVVA